MPLSGSLTGQQALRSLFKVTAHDTRGADTRARPMDWPLQTQPPGDSTPAWSEGDRQGQAWALETVSPRLGGAAQSPLISESPLHCSEIVEAQPLRQAGAPAGSARCSGTPVLSRRWTSGLSGTRELAGKAVILLGLPQALHTSLTRERVWDVTLSFPPSP